MVSVLAALGLHYYTHAFSSSSEEGLPLLAMHRLRFAVASPCCGAQAVGRQA